MDEKKLKWDKPALVSIDETTLGVCGMGSTFLSVNCNQGPAPDYGCSAGGNGRGTYGCVSGPGATEQPCSVGTGVTGAFGAPMRRRL